MHSNELLICVLEHAWFIALSRNRAPANRVSSWVSCSCLSAHLSCSDCPDGAVSIASNVKPEPLERTGMHGVGGDASRKLRRLTVIITFSFEGMGRFSGSHVCILGMLWGLQINGRADTSCSQRREVWFLHVRNSTKRSFPLCFALFGSPNKFYTLDRLGIRSERGRIILHRQAFFCILFF